MDNIHVDMYNSCKDVYLISPRGAVQCIILYQTQFNNNKINSTRNPLCVIEFVRCQP